MTIQVTKHDDFLHSNGIRLGGRYFVNRIKRGRVFIKHNNGEIMLKIDEVKVLTYSGKELKILNGKL